jgi:hypothetical protein
VAACGETGAAVSGSRKGWGFVVIQRMSGSEEGFCNMALVDYFIDSIRN